jgi:hypothetical protein
MFGLLKWNGILFDDYGYFAGGGKGNFWSQVSEEDVQKYGIDRHYLDEAGQGICGIQGHSEEADYYIDFPMDEIEFVKE